jgi:DNA-binding LacI/PurR family transcriptional regulator
MVSRPSARPARPRKPTIVDVSEAAGVSVATVSRILNDKPDVAPATRAKVLRVMDEIGFAPQSAWRQIRSGRSGLIAMHCPQDFNPPAHGVIMAAALGVEEAGYSINVITRHLSDAELLAIFRSREADGIILLEILVDDRRAALLRDHGYPFAMIGHRAESDGMSFVDVDEQHSIDLALDHLVGLGHCRVGFLNLDPVLGEATYGYSVWAQQAYERACERLGLPVLADVGGRSPDEMSAAAQNLLAAHPEITAFVALQDQSIIGLVKAARALGLRVPDDLSIVGMGMASTSMAEMATPPLTTVSFPEDDLGRVAARLLLERIEHGRTIAEQVLVRPELAVRGSTARPRDGAIDGRG